MEAAALAEPADASDSSEPHQAEFSPPLDPADLPYVPYECDADMKYYERQVVATKNRNLDVLYHLGLCPADRLRETVEANVKLAEAKRFLVVKPGNCPSDLEWNRTVTFAE